MYKLLHKVIKEGVVNQNLVKQIVNRFPTIEVDQLEMYTTEDSTAGVDDLIVTFTKYIEVAERTHLVNGINNLTMIEKSLKTILVSRQINVELRQKITDKEELVWFDKSTSMVRTLKTVRLTKLFVEHGEVLELLADDTEKQLVLKAAKRLIPSEGLSQELLHELQDLFDTLGFSSVNKLYRTSDITKEIVEMVIVASQKIIREEVITKGMKSILTLLHNHQELVLNMLKAILYILTENKTDG